MAKVIIQRVWEDGDCLTVSIRLENSYPDCVAEGVGAAVRAYKEALEISVGPDDEAAE